MPEALPPIERRANILAATPPLRLGVNIDHVATVRNARGGTHPDPVRAAMIAIEAGADGITAHLREDRRHIRDADIARLKAEIVKPLNLEMAATPELVAIAVKTRPHAACIVPERRGEVTTEGGLDAVGQYNLLAPAVAKLNEAAIRVSLFIAPDPKQIEAAARLAGPGHRNPYRRLVRGVGGTTHRGSGGGMAAYCRGRKARDRISASKFMPATAWIMGRRR